ncbi:hypothetical protein PQR15_23735 [Streptomyces lydicus]|nr:hypothetical protein [Streptomyces lydicus]
MPLCRSGAVDEDGRCERCGHARPRARDHMERELAGLAAVSDLGHRHHRNEDFFALRSAALPDGALVVVAVVCDGVSSATRPDEASQAASEAAGEALLASLPRGTHPNRPCTRPSWRPPTRWTRWPPTPRRHTTSTASRTPRPARSWARWSAAGC